MVDGITAALRAWIADPEIAHVVVRQTGERAFCAGGDIRQQHDAGRAGAFDQAIAFFRDEYRLNRMIKRYPKPYIALIDGIVMGGGVGISVHGSHRVGTEKLLFAMPEVSIGFFPDVGGSYFLPRLPGEIGMYLALTGERLGIADALWSGVVTHHIASADLPDVFDALLDATAVDETLDRFARDAGPSELAAKVGDIERLLRGRELDDARAVLRAAAEGGDPFAGSVEDTIRARSPTSVAVTFREIREGAALSFEDCMRMELRIAAQMVRSHDFYEGVRAVILDKDNAPRWNPPTLEAVAPADVAAHFASGPDRELAFN
jgi:enoyl-CoA hydratase